MSKVLSSLLQICLYALGFSFTASQMSLAQVTSDGTVDTQVRQSGNIAEITGGQRRGGNLFHSFQDFSVRTGNEAFFNNASNIENILSRVTGGNISNIDGLIRANGSANLFLVNPAGIIFGEGARLDIGGSFYSSTASSILFEDGEFSAADLENPPLLTINAPIGLGFRDNPGEIINRSVVGNSPEETVGLQVLPGNNIALVGGNINLNAGNLTAEGGRIELGSLSQEGTVGIAEDGSLNFGKNTIKADINLSNAADIDVRGSGGSINLNARNLTISGDGSSIRAGIAADFSSSQAQAGDITINATDNITIDNSSIANLVELDAIGNAGNINIATSNLNLSNKGRIEASTFGTGNSGAVRVTSDAIAIDTGEFASAPSGIFSHVETEAVGNSGGANITTTNLTITDGGRIASNTAGEGNSGSVNITASENITFDGRRSSDVLASGVASRVDGGGKGNSGGVNITTTDLTITNGAAIDAGTSGQGNAGLVDITATDSITIDAKNSTNPVTGITSIVREGAVGNSATVNINTANLSIFNGGRIAANTSGTGDAGQINVTATNSITFDGRNSQGDVRSGISSRVDRDGIGNSKGVNVTTGNLTLSNEGVIEATTLGDGNAGSIDVDTERLTITNGGRIAANTSGIGDAGLVNIFATDSITIDGKNFQSEIFSGVASRVDDIGKGNSGSVNITTSDLTISNEGVIEATTLAEGDAGQVNIIADDITLTNGGRVDTNTQDVGNAGSLTVNASSIALKGKTENFRSNMSANALIGSGNSGNVNIFTDRLTVEDGAAIEASNFDSLGNIESGIGQPGNINIEANSIGLSNGGRIEAITQSLTGNNANINLTVADNITLQNNSFISAEAVGEAKGGNSNIDTDFIIAFPNGNNDIIANAERGQGGNIEINATLFGIEERALDRSTNDISASSDVMDLDGNVTINSLNSDRLKESKELPSKVVQPKQTITQVCQANREAVAENIFTIEGKGGIPPTPDSPLDSRNIAIDGQSNLTSAIPKPIETSVGKIQPARGIKVTKSGVVLTAYQTSSVGNRLLEIERNCT